MSRCVPRAGCLEGIETRVAGRCDRPVHSAPEGVPNRWGRWEPAGKLDSSMRSDQSEHGRPAAMAIDADRSALHPGIPRGHRRILVRRFPSPRH